MSDFLSSRNQKAINVDMNSESCERQSSLLSTEVKANIVDNCQLLSTIFGKDTVGAACSRLQCSGTCQ